MFLKKISLKSFIHNLKSFLKEDIRKNINDLKLQILYLKIISHQKEDFKNKYQNEISYLQEIGTVKVFPYHKTKNPPPIRVEYDKKKGLVFAMHNNKKLYFHKKYNIKQVAEMYTDYIQNENILGIGGGYTEKCPHQYQSKNHFVEEGDILVDIGCAEALLTLDVIEKVKKVYLFESNPLWIPALKATFEPYKDKVTIINKLVSDTNTKTSIRLDNVLKSEDMDNIFIKMDIEGYEKQVLLASKDFLQNIKNKTIKISCCTYHKHDDAKDIANFLESIHFNIEYSDGYMLFFYDEEPLRYPYFRKAMIRASNQK